MPDQDPTDQLRNVLESGRAVRLSRGVIGKTGHVALAVIVMWGVVIGRWSDSVVMDAGLLLAGTVATAFAVWWTRASQRFAERNPAQAMLEGADFLEYRRMEIEEKGRASLPAGPAVLLDTEAVDREDR